MTDCSVRNLHFCRLFCPQPALSSSALCALLILFVALPTSFFVVSSQLLLKYSRSPRCNLRDLDSSVCVCFQACTQQRPCTMGYGYQGSGAQMLANCSGKLYGLARARHEKKIYMHSSMLGFFSDLFHAFHNAGILTRLDIMYIILQHISMFLIQEIGPEACCCVRYAPESCLA